MCSRKTGPVWAGGYTGLLYVCRVGSFSVGGNVVLGLRGSARLPILCCGCHQPWWRLRAYSLSSGALSSLERAPYVEKGDRVATCHAMVGRASCFRRRPRREVCVCYYMYKRASPARPELTTNEEPRSVSGRREHFSPTWTRFPVRRLDRVLIARSVLGA